MDRNSRFFQHSLVRAFGAATLCSTFVLSAQAQSFTSTAELKTACELNPGNVVILNVPTQITSGPQAPSSELVDTKCTIVVAPNTALEFNQVAMTFAGPLVIQGDSEAHALFLESQFSAPSVSINLDSKSEVLIERGAMSATAGAVSVALGNEAKFDVRGPLATPVLSATDAISLRTGAKSSVTITDAVVQAGAGVSAMLAGGETVFALVGSTLDAGLGGVSVSADAKSIVAITTSNVSASGGVAVALMGAEAELVASGFSLTGGSGPVTLVSSGTKGKLTLADGTVSSGAGVRIEAALTASEGVAFVQKVAVEAIGAVSIQSGLAGVSEVLDSNLNADRSLTIQTGAGGSCKSDNNTIVSPSSSICAPAAPPASATKLGAPRRSLNGNLR